MKSEKTYLVCRLGGYGLTIAVLFGALSGCTTDKKACNLQPTQYRVPKAHIEMHERMMAGQHQLINTEKSNESNND